MTRQITAIYGMVPFDDRVERDAWVVGYESNIAGVGATRVDWIERREENYGDHGLSWFDVLSEGKVVASVQARAVAEVHYGPEGTA
jgi:hypothetical protein